MKRKRTLTLMLALILLFANMPFPSRAMDAENADDSQIDGPVYIQTVSDPVPEILEGTYAYALKGAQLSAKPDGASIGEVSKESPVYVIERRGLWLRVAFVAQRGGERVNCEAFVPQWRLTALTPSQEESLKEELWDVSRAFYWNDSVALPTANVKWIDEEVSPVSETEATVTPEPETTIEPEATVTPEPETTIEPEATVTPEPETTVEPEATVTPEPETTIEPEATVTPEPETTIAPEAAVTPEPEVTPAPSADTVPDETPSTDPECVCGAVADESGLIPHAERCPSFVAPVIPLIEVVLPALTVAVSPELPILAGEVTLTAQGDPIENAAFQWQTAPDVDSDWRDIENATGREYVLTLTDELAQARWRYRAMIPTADIPAAQAEPAVPSEESALTEAQNADQATEPDLADQPVAPSPEDPLSVVTIAEGLPTVEVVSEEITIGQYCIGCAALEENGQIAHAYPCPMFASPSCSCGAQSDGNGHIRHEWNCPLFLCFKCGGYGVYNHLPDCEDYVKDDCACGMEKYDHTYIHASIDCPRTQRAVEMVFRSRIKDTAAYTTKSDSGAKTLKSSPGMSLKSAPAPSPASIWEFTYTLVYGAATDWGTVDFLIAITSPGQETLFVIDGDLPSHSSTITIPSSLTIGFCAIGDSGSGIIRRAGDTYPLFTVASGATLHLIGDVILDGNKSVYPSSNYPLVQNNGTLIVDDAILQNNSNANRGGAIYANQNSTTTVTNSIIRNCNADLGGSAIYTASSATAVNISNSAISGNTTNERSGAVFLNGTTCVANNVTFSGNTTTINGLTTKDGTIGCAVVSDFSDTTLNNCTFVNNSFAGNDPSSLQTGSAVASSLLDTLTINGCTFDGNDASAKGAVYSTFGSLSMRGAMNFAQPSQNVYLDGVTIATPNGNEPTLVSGSAPIPIDMPDANWANGTDVMKNTNNAAATVRQATLFDVNTHKSSASDAWYLAGSAGTLELQNNANNNFVYVSGTGNDTRFVSTPSAPFQTLRRCYAFMKHNAVSATIVVVGTVAIGSAGDIKISKNFEYEIHR